MPAIIALSGAQAEQCAMTDVHLQQVLARQATGASEQQTDDAAMGHQQHTTAGMTLAQASLGGQHPRLELDSGSPPGGVKA